ncbi:ubiquitin-protein ligase molybdopterin-converting factor [Halteromyces radiatus]|uniref:ubiquitin-protein ligase molybdopterin-converting factor n=1 Tax=Halteromyces radiatus TaxID=101107 RepID=UPI00221E3F8B|nr:ubiquitin-protein ligase molybdopterin-converting factor [Halteromyces radiatus]KAI8088696.1 ubiquitin-protein ligase molybdopterin-converting factor [Halteromyces radiatus]
MDRLSTLFAQQDDRTKFTLTAIAASILTASSIIGYQELQRQRRKHGKQQVSSLDHEARFMNNINTPVLKIAPTPHYISGEQAILGDDKTKQLQDAFVIVVGAGGVGSWAALMLLRAGVRRLRLIDFDQVTLSSLNRHAVATLDDVGTPKVKTMQRHFERISPTCQLDARIDLFNADNADDLLSGHPDYIIDAIDNINTKIDLIRYCYDHNLKVISSMGAGAKADPSRIQITDISETLEDPLARTVRRHLKKYNIEYGVPVAYSTEKPHHVKLLPLEEDRVEEADDFAALPDFRSRILPVLGTIPSMFGMAIANHVILELTQYPGYHPLPIKLREGLYGRLYRDLIVRESREFNTKVCPMDVKDVAYIFEEIWHGKSVLTGPQNQMALVRWDKTKPLNFMNTVVMSKEEARRHDALSSDVDLSQHYGQDICIMIEKRLKEEEGLRKIWDSAL